MVGIKKVIGFLKAIFAKWGKDEAPRLAASLAFFTVLSLAPLLVLVTLVAGLVFGEGAARQQLISQAQDVIGSEGAQVFGEVLDNAAEPGGGGIIASIISFATLLFGASNVVVQLQNSLDRIWDVAPDPKQGLMNTVKNRLFAFLIVIGIGLLLLASLVLSAFLTGLQAVGDAVPGGVQVLNIAISLVIFTLLFAVVFKVVPNAQIRWRDVWVGAAVTAVLFLVGRTLMSLYLGGGGVTSVYGAAGAFMALLLWLFYSAQILFFGAEFTQVYTTVRGEAILPTNNAIPIAEAREKQEREAAENIAKARGADASS